MKSIQGHLVLILIFSLSGFSAGAQTFSSGSNGSDGALDLTGQTGTIVFNPESFNPSLDPDHDNVYHFTTIKIPAGLNVRLLASTLGSKAVIWLASGAVDIRGALDLNGAGGHGLTGPAIPSVAGAGGYGGGVGGTSISAARLGDGPGGGRGSGGGAGFAVQGEGLNQSGGAAYGNAYLLPMVGGSGGAGGAYYGGGGGNPNGAGGGAGGGGLLIASSESITLAPGSAIYANGGPGTCNSGNFPPNQSSGGGSGGAIRLMAPTFVSSGEVLARGGTSCNSGGAGSPGRIRLEAYSLNVAGQINPAPTVATPGLVFPPTSAPSVRLTSIGGVAVPANPTASYIVPDVTLDNATSVNLEIAASKVPVGTVVHLTLTPETGSIVTVDSTPLAGTFDASTASATITIPHGFSRFSVQASWTP